MHAPELIEEPPLPPDELQAFHARMERFEKNSQWFSDHAVEIGERHAGKYICVAGLELFAADTPREARELARAAHPDDESPLCRYVSPHRGARIYARLG